MRRIVAFGSNATGSLDPRGGPVLDTPIDITDTVACTEIVWHGWACTIGRGPGGYKAWGSRPFVQDGIQIITCTGEPLKFIGLDSPVGYLGEDRRVYTFDGKLSPADRSWGDVAVTGLGTVYAFEKDTIYRFESLDHFLKLEVGAKLQHPLVKECNTAPPKLYVSESRCLLHSDMNLFEVVSSPPPEHELTLRQIEEITEFEPVIRPGTRNRFAIVCEGGLAYLLDTRDEQPSLVEIDDLDVDSVERYTVGSDFEVVESEEGVTTRGSNTFGQLGGEPGEDGWVRIPIGGPVVDILSSRWSTIITFDDREGDGVEATDNGESQLDGQVE